MYDPFWEAVERLENIELKVYLFSVHYHCSAEFYFAAKVMGVTIDGT